MGKNHVLAKSCLPPQWIILLGCSSLFSVVASTPFFRAVLGENTQIPCDKSRKILTAPYGEITDGPAGLNYTQDSHCLWLIKAANDSQFITLNFHTISTECSYDYVYVYDGDSFNSTLLGSFSGRTEPQSMVATSGYMLILLYSDTNYVLNGFSATYYISNCLNHCHNHGKCVGHQCVCHGEWVGPDCEDEVCPDKCGVPQGRGKCIKGVCKCNENYSGRQCDLSSDPQGGNWRWLSTDAEGLTGRAAHTSIYLEEQDALYVFGGYDLNNIIDSLQVYRFATSHWEDEWGIQLQNRHHTYHPHKIDNTLLKAVLTNKNDEDAKLWGLKSEKSFFTSILRTLAESNLHQNQRKSRSPLNSSLDEEIVDILDDILENVTDNKPSPRFGHAAENVPGGFVIYGGQLEDGSLSDELWFYNATGTGGEWIRRATNSSFKPPALARHTLTLAEDYLYLFGGSLQTGEFSSRIYRLKLNQSHLNSEFWEEVHPRGGKVLDIRLAAHSTIYYKYTNSLVVFGGIQTNVARFSKLSDRIFMFQLDEKHWTEIHYPRTALRDINIPHERAYHTATISGNYMIIFGGYTHRHNKDEICYDNHMYWYHLGCHIWINQDVHRDTKYYPKTQGVFAHSASLRKGHTLLITGGYHGNVNSDLFAYELPQIMRVHDPKNYSPENYCRLHNSHTSCLSDPECGWCSADNSCYGRTIGANCTTNLQITRCPGICPSLTDCHSCLIHGTEYSGEQKTYSVASKLGLNQCNWCVQNSRCHHKDDTYGICGEDTPSTNPGWWGEQGKEIESAMECSKYDIRPGMTFIKYNHPVNFSQPDFVQIINSTIVSFTSPLSSTQTDHGFGGEMIGRFIGYIRPQPKEIELQTDFQFCISQASAALRLGFDDGEFYNISTQPFLCKSVRPSDERFLIDFKAKRRVGIGSLYSNHHKTQMELQHITHGSAKPYSFEYLEPFSDGKCFQYKNCLHCMTDALCGWCSLTSICLPRNVNESVICVNHHNWNYLVIQPEQCANCSNYINCNDCLESSECEWWIDDAKCERIGRTAHSVRNLEKCPKPCKARSGCSECLDKRGRCVWCESSQQCFSFSAYTSEFQFGMCREWYDQVLPLITPAPGQNITALSLNLNKKPQCKSCSYFKECASCLKALNCGWCYDSENPIKGKCVAGDFSSPVGTCNSVLNTTHATAEWAYAQCPDVDECNLNIHHCHKEAKCTNTHGSYTCQCKRGYIGDGRISCIRTCYETCVKGRCSNSPNYECICDLGWTGIDCSIDCGCNNHSNCNEKVGVCEACQDWTEGEHCERCRPGSYGNATTSDGCSPCECNGHGNQDLGVCDTRTGHCFCQDNTDGLKCERCQKNYYGDPKNGGTCYYQCESRGFLTGLEKKSFGSFHSFKNPWSDHEVHECLWAVSPAGLTAPVLITLDIDWKTMNVNCDENAAYVYDGQPDLLGQYPQSQLVGVICEPYTVQRPIETRSGHMTVYFKQTGQGKDGFNAHYSIKSCENSSCRFPHICDYKQKCICPGTKIGPKCKENVCPEECNYKTHHGFCDVDYGRCICNTGWAGNACETKVQSHQLISQTLFNTANLYEQFEHLRITIPRFGHSLSADKRGSLWMFGGYSLPNGPLNDMRLYDTKNASWLQVTVESAPNDKMPLGRYFHSSDIHLTRQTIYVFGGMTNSGRNKPNVILDDFWQFSIQNQRWDEVEVLSKERPPRLAGHTLTFIKNMDQEYLLLVGGISLNISNHLQLWMYDLESSKWERLQTTGTRVPPLYGHSTVFHHPSGIVYVFGGYTNEPQNKLYALNINMLTWTELPVFRELNGLESNLPRARYFHSAVTTDQYMIVYGGRSHPYNESDVLNAYVYQCNQWIRLSEDVEVIGTLPTGTYAEAVAMDQETKAIYISGGWNGGANSMLTRITLPEDICRLWSKGKYMCRHFMGCSFCTIKHQKNPESYCVSDNEKDVCKPPNNTTVAFNKGAVCDDEWMSRRNCSTFKTCSSCLASWPAHSETTPSPVCQWCEREDCVSSCVPAGTDCSQDFNWCQKHTSVGFLQECPLPKCHLLKCEECFEAENCEWVITDLGTSQCISKDAIQKHDYKILGKCPEPCDSFTTCSTCLDVESENPKNCRWSTQLNACIYPNLNQIYCAFGVCGLVLDSKNIKHCPEPCSTHTQCSSCLSHAHCAWCGMNNTNGGGMCTEEFPESLTEYSPESICETVYLSGRNVTEEKFSWNYMECPAEDECANGHHKCNPKSQKCVDEPHGYRCVCGEGYKDDEGECVPVCRDGCVRGQCIEPDHCLCDFGYVGTNCSIQCQCNGHSDCKGPDRLDDCIKCHNNTMGEQCEKCQPLFVGNPRDGRSCIPCTDYCYGHTDVCISPDSDPAFFNMSKVDLEKNLKEGPLENATCLRCNNFTAGARCDTCLLGFFRPTFDYHTSCMKCQCHGHGDICDPSNGEKCNCGNNTESDGTCTAGGGKNSVQQCWKVQCSKCRDSYAGNPTDGHQCYKQITVESRMCFDAKPIEECKVKPSPLRPGQTVFFVIQPRFMNVDIRILIDVTQGELDVYMSPLDDSFIVETNQSTGHHSILLDNRYYWEPYSTIPLNIAQPRYSSNYTKRPLNYPSMANDCKTLIETGFYVQDHRAKDLSTFVTLHRCNTLLRVFSLRNRLVLTLPQSAHNLSATRFFIALRASGVFDHSYGSIVFRQDQLHIDLFVFFSVFFSCFFLFLAICVVAWKAKQAADLRRARRRHVVELLHMAKRPFSTIYVSVNPELETPGPVRRRGRSKSVTISLNDVRLITIEPTFDNLAAIGTVLISLPGKYECPNTLTLGSALITLPRQYPLNTRNIRRRRGSNIQTTSHSHPPLNPPPPNIVPPPDNAPVVVVEPQP